MFDEVDHARRTAGRVQPTQRPPTRVRAGHHHRGTGLEGSSHCLHAVGRQPLEPGRVDQYHRAGRHLVPVRRRCRLTESECVERAATRLFRADHTHRHTHRVLLTTGFALKPSGKVPNPHGNDLSSSAAMVGLFARAVPRPATPPPPPAPTRRRFVCVLGSALRSTSFASIQPPISWLWPRRGQGKPPLLSPVRGGPSATMAPPAAHVSSWWPPPAI